MSGLLRSSGPRLENRKDLHHGRNTERSDESFVPGQEDLREVLGDGEDGSDETVPVERKKEGDLMSFSNDAEMRRGMDTKTHASAILESLISGASLGLG